MSEFHDNYPVYEVMANHGEEEGKKGRKILWKVFWVMLAITVFELIVGFMAPSKGWSGTFALKALFISLTIVKAAAIVLWFMHLKHEATFFKWAILSMYFGLMCYAIFVILTEGTYSGGATKMTRVDPIFIEQQVELAKHKHGAAAEHGDKGHEAAPAGEATHH